MVHTVRADHGYLPKVVVILLLQIPTIGAETQQFCECRRRRMDEPAQAFINCLSGRGFVTTADEVE